MNFMSIRKLWKQLLLVSALVTALLYMSQYHRTSTNIPKYFKVTSGSQNSGSDSATVADRGVKEDSYKGLLEQLNRDKVAQDDPRLIKVIQEHFIELPSTQPYKLKQPDRIDYSEGQSSAVDRILNEMVYLLLKEAFSFTNYVFSYLTYYQNILYLQFLSATNDCIS